MSGEKPLNKIDMPEGIYRDVYKRQIHVLLDCNIVLGGYVGEYMGPYIDDLQVRVVKLSTFCDNADFLKLCSYKKEAIAAGAAMRFIADFTDSV